MARVAVEISLPNLDRPFDFLVPDTLDAAAVPGCRVRVRFAGRLTSGFLLERVAESEYEGKLGYLERVVSPEPVLGPEIAGLARAVADRYGGTMADVLRLAIPPRHAAAEGSPRAGAADKPPAAGGEAEAGTWSRYEAGGTYLSALAAGRSPRAVWSALPGPHWPDEIALAAAATAASGRGTVIVVPDARDLARVDAALSRRLPGRPARGAGGGSGSGRALPALAGGGARRGVSRRRVAVRGAGAGQPPRTGRVVG